MGEGRARVRFGPEHMPYLRASGLPSALLSRPASSEALALLTSLTFQTAQEFCLPTPVSCQDLTVCPLGARIGKESC